MHIFERVITLIVVGLVAGFVAATILGERRRYHLVGYVALGAVGAIGGTFVFREMQLPHVGLLWELIAAILGSLVLVLILRVLRH